MGGEKQAFSVEAAVVHRTIAFLLQHQDAADFPAIVELEDVVASYPDYRSALTGWSTADARGERP